MPLFLIPIAFTRFHYWTGIVNRIWARSFFFCLFMPVKIEYREKLEHRKQYVFCPNHNSYLDIPSLGFTRINSVFVGKEGPDKVPLFGWMYKKLHITVNRESLKSKYNTFLRTSNAVEEGKSLIIFPEGGIINEKAGQLAPLKEGPFRLAIEKQIPVVPVTIPNNWIILPLNLLLRWKPVWIIFHEPIPTEGLTSADMSYLKSRVKKVIEDELKKIQAHEN